MFDNRAILSAYVVGAAGVPPAPGKIENVKPLVIPQRSEGTYPSTTQIPNATHNVKSHCHPEAAAAEGPLCSDSPSL